MTTPQFPYLVSFQAAIDYIYALSDILEAHDANVMTLVHQQQHQSVSKRAPLPSGAIYPPGGINYHPTPSSAPFLDVYPPLEAAQAPSWSSYHF